MPIVVFCSNCERKINTPNELAGRTVKCPKCGNPVKVPNTQSSARSRNQITRSPRTPSQNEGEGEELGLREQKATLDAPRASTGLGVASFVLGIVAFLISWIPCVGLLSMPLSGLGLILGIVGIILALSRRGSGVGLSIAGSALSFLALLIPIIMTWVLGAFFKVQPENKSSPFRFQVQGGPNHVAGQRAGGPLPPIPAVKAPQNARGQRANQGQMNEAGKVDEENAEVMRVLAALKTPNKGPAIETIVKHAKHWKSENCVRVAQELGNIEEKKAQVSRALCEIIARLQPEPLASQIAKKPQQVALQSLERVNPRLYQVVMDFLTVSYGRGGNAARKFLDIGDDGKAASPILRERVTHFANGKSAGSTIFETFGDEVAACVNVLIVLAPDETETLHAVVGIVRAYAERTGPRGYHPTSMMAVSRITSLIDHLGSFGSKAKDAAPILQNLKFDENARIRKAAADALEKVSR